MKHYFIISCIGAISLRGSLFVLFLFQMGEGEGWNTRVYIVVIESPIPLQKKFNNWTQSTNEHALFCPRKLKESNYNLKATHLLLTAIDISEGLPEVAPTLLDIPPYGFALYYL